MGISSTFLKRETSKPDWLLVDADGQVLGRLASRVCLLLMGKHKPSYTPHVDSGDYVVVINARGIRLTGNKAEMKEYIWHTRWPGGQKRRSYRDTVTKDPTEPLREAVRKMLPKTRLGRAFLRKLKVYPDQKHVHAANRPKPHTLTA
jgi:large subunit ribosomal protein L13